MMNFLHGKHLCSYVMKDLSTEKRSKRPSNGESQQLKVNGYGILCVLGR